MGNGCKQLIEISIPTRYHYRLVQVRCGSTGPNGYPNLCDKCAEDFDAKAYRENCEANGERIEDDY